MASFDIINAVMNTYALIWRERAYLLRLAAVPFVISLINFLFIGLIADDVTPLRRGLLMFPAMVAEGWLVAQFLRTVMTGERWPVMRPEHGKIPITLLLRVRGLMTCAIVYVLIVLLSNGVLGLTATLFTEEKLKELSTAPDPAYTVGSFLLII